MKPLPCPCGSGHPYSACCGPAHEGLQLASTAERLMRARYTAYALGNEAYLMKTWHTTTRPAPPLFDTRPAPKWIGLQVRAHRLVDERNAIVEFIARYRVGGRAHRLHETSRFVLEGGSWFYVDGDLHDADKVT